MMLAIDLKKSVKNPRVDNFTCLLFWLIMRADSKNKNKLAREYPVEVEMVDIFKTPGRCPRMADVVGNSPSGGMKLGPERVDWDTIEKDARATLAGKDV